MSKIVNIEDYVASDTLVMNFTVRDTAGAAVDITGAEVTWLVLRKRGNTVAEVVRLSSAGVSPKISLTSPLTGQLRVRLESDILAVAGTYEHQLKIDLDGDLETVAHGKLVAKAST